MFSIVCLGSSVWGHHMFTVGLDVKTAVFFSSVTMIIGVPTGIKVFTWLYMLLNSKMNKGDPVIWWIISFIVLFTFGGVTGIILSACVLDKVLHDTWFVVAHFHYVMSLGSYISIIIMFIWWWPLITGLSLNKCLLQCQCIVSNIGFNLCFFPMHYFGMCGLPRRVCIYEVSYSWVNLVCTIGSFITAFSGCFFVFILWESIVRNNVVLGFYGSSGFLTNFVYVPVGYHKDYFTYSYSIDYTYGVYNMHWIGPDLYIVNVDHLVYLKYRFCKSKLVYFYWSWSIGCYYWFCWTFLPFASCSLDFFN